MMAIRLLCSYLFHMTTYGDVVDSWQRLKFLKNNPSLFETQYLLVALVIPLYQMSVTVFCEILNMYFITLQNDSMQLVLNYVAISCITQIDNLYVETVRKFYVKEVLFENESELKEHL